MILFSLLLFMNCLTEYLLNKMMVTLDVLEERYSVYHAACAVLRIMWIFTGAWLAVPLPVILIGLFILLFLNAIPYPKRRLLVNSFILILYLIFTSLIMTLIGGAGLLGYDVESILRDRSLRGIIMNSTFIFFNVLCALLLHYFPEFLWKEDYDKSKVVIYTRFLFICAIYHIMDSVILTLYPAGRINYLLLLSGDALILVLMFNFLNYNYVFAKSEEMRREYEDSEVQFAQQYFEKQSLIKLSGFDSLTNAYNRREICSIMEEQIQEGHPLTCVFIDLDGLKRANDKYGHTFGDFMLKRFADACVEGMQGKGSLARIGGDEFLLVFPDEEIGDVEAFVKTLQLKLLEPAEDKEKIFFSYGISHGQKSVDSYILMADQKMYANKVRKQHGDI